MIATEQGWRPIKSAPFQTVIEVRNPRMERPCRATRGYNTELGVHRDTTFCTTVFTPPAEGDYMPTPAGQLVCPTEWRPAEQSA